MSIEALLGAGVLLIGGVAFALFLGLSSTRADHEREEQAGNALP